MSELDEKLNEFLSDPARMAQVMQLASQLSAGAEGSPSPPPEPPPTSDGKQPEGPDAQLLAKVMPFLREYRQSSSQTMQLLMALRPFLKPEKQEKVARAAQLSHLIHVGKRFLLERGDGHV